MSEEMKETMKISAETNKRMLERTGEIGERAAEGAVDTC